MYAFIDTASHAGGDLSSVAPTAIRSRTADRPDAGSTRQRERRKSLCCGPCQGRSSSLTIWFRRSYGCLISRRHHWNTHQAKGVNHGSFGKILNNYAERTLVLPSRPQGAPREEPQLIRVPGGRSRLGSRSSVRRPDCPGTAGRAVRRLSAGWSRLPRPPTTRVSSPSQATGIMAGLLAGVIGRLRVAWRVDQATDVPAVTQHECHRPRQGRQRRTTGIRDMYRSSTWHGMAAIMSVSV